MNKKKVKQHEDKSLQYYRDTLRRNEVVSDVIGLKDFVKRFKKFNPHIDKIIHNYWFQCNVPHECYSNALLMATIVLPNEFQYVEGLLVEEDQVYHHAFLYSKSLRCYIDPTIENPKDFIYFISDNVDDIERLFSLLHYDKDIDSYFPSWKNEDIISKARIRKRRKDEGS